MKSKVVCVRKVKLGEGRPKICIPVVGRTREEIYSQTENLLRYPADLVEWRADWFEELLNKDKMLDVLKMLREQLGEIPLLFTIRTAKEGGKAALSPEQYRDLNLAAAKSGFADLVDIEVFQQTQGEALIAGLQREGVKVIGSAHDFSKTPEIDTMVEYLQNMQRVGADICKLAVMPRCRDDVAALLMATWQMNKCYADRPLITMSMGGEGLVSRLTGEIFGSAVTFGCAGQASAPGQMEAGQLARWLEVLHSGENGIPKENASDVDLKTKFKGHIFLIGFMGAGKSTVAAALEEKLGRKKIEMDACIEKSAGQSINEMFETHGEAYFRNIETNFLLSLEKEAPSVVSCGGGIVVRDENTRFMRSYGKIVLLTATPETILERVRDSGERPILNGNMNVDFIRQLQEKRRALYEAAADLVVATDGKSVEEICGEILEGISEV